MFDWNDIRLFLAIAESGSALGAARLLGLNQTTVARRMDVLECRLGLTLFERRNLGYRLTEEGKSLRALAAPMAECATGIMAHAVTQRRRLSGTIRVTAPEIIFAHFLAPIVAEFQVLHPEVQIEYDSSETLADLVRGEADVAFRATERPHDDGLVVRKLSEICWTLYCSRSYAEGHGRPSAPEETDGHTVVAYSGRVAERRGNVWFMSHVSPAQVVGYSSTVMNMTAILRAGVGVGLLPCMQGDRDKTLVRCCAPRAELDSHFWMLTAESHRHVPRIDAFVALAGDRFRARRPELRGLRPLPD